MQATNQELNKILTDQINTAMDTHIPTQNKHPQTKNSKYCNQNNL